MRVCKFGGAALRDGEGFRRVKEIAAEDGSRQIIVPSAPGRRDGGDEKITDLLYACQTAAEAGRGFGHLFDRIAGRYREIAAALRLPAPDDDLREIFGGLRRGASPAWAASRGEWLCGRLLAAYLDMPFVDAASVIRFDAAGNLLERDTTELLRQMPVPCVLPGFYGADGLGTVHTFPRGGSDVTAALAAAARNADVYENWKDVRGVFAADPELVPDAQCVTAMSYRELRALSALGARVLAEEAVAPVRRAGVPLTVRSFLEPRHPGTRIGPAFGGQSAAEAIGVTGRSELRLYRLERLDGGETLARSALEAGLPLFKLAVDADALCLALRGDEPLPEALQALSERVWQHRAASVSAVGEGLRRADGAARFAAALSAAGVRAYSLHMPPDGLYVTAVIPEADFARSVAALYDAFIRR